MQVPHPDNPYLFHGMKTGFSFHRFDRWMSHFAGVEQPLDNYPREHPLDQFENWSGVGTPTSNNALPLVATLLPS